MQLKGQSARGGGSLVNRLCVICARGGSKGIKNKNLRELAGKPLIHHTIEQARRSEKFTAIAVSSDSKRILNAAAAANVDHLVERPPELATDNAPKVPAIRHCTEISEYNSGLQFDTIVDLDATSPLRNIDDIKAAISLLENSNAPNVVSGMPSRRSPYFNLVELDDHGRVVLSKKLSRPIVRRQDSPKCFDLNASVFVWSRVGLFSDHDTVFQGETILFEMPEARSIDIDTELDFKIVELLMAERGA
jgi:CMP-N,N'-diacetyllegionaminic acid synthase